MDRQNGQNSDIMKGYMGTATLTSPGPAGDQARAWFTYHKQLQDQVIIQKRLNEIERKLDIIAAAFVEHLKLDKDFFHNE